MDLKTLDWIEDIITMLNIPKDSLPEIKPSLYNYGTNSNLLSRLL